MGEQVSIRLSDEYQKLMDDIKWVNRVDSRSEMLRIMINRTAADVGLAPVEEVVKLTTVSELEALGEVV